ncbi:MAG: exodeoxyribonuclease VII small subunit [Planctomycetota bacterium]
MPERAKSPDAKLSFEDALDELEQITAKMERGDLSLDASLEAYERGTKLVQLCQHRLDSAERRIEELGKGKDGSLTSKPMDA